MGGGRGAAGRRAVLLAAVVLAAGVVLGGEAAAAPEVDSTVSAGSPPLPPDYSGSLATRPAVTGDWGGARDELAKKGLAFDTRVTQVGQTITNGGDNPGWKYGGRWDEFMTLDTQRMGLWPGGIFRVEVEGHFGQSVNPFTGALLPVNTAQIFPEPGKEGDVAVPAVAYTQFLSPNFGVFIGKLATVTQTAGDMNDFAHGKGDTQFLNLAFNFNPAAVLIIPRSTLGGGIVLRQGDKYVGRIAAFDSDGTATQSGFHTIGEGNTTFATEHRLTTDFFDRTGHQLVGAAYSSKNFGSTTGGPGVIVNGAPVSNSDNSWVTYYNFDQYISETGDKGSGRGFGPFGRLGLTEGKANPVHWFGSLGLGGRGVCESRPDDRFGVGYYYVNVINGGLPAVLGFENTQGVEAFYNVAITPAIQLTPDVQVIAPSQRGFDTAVVVGLRLEILL